MLREAKKAPRTSAVFLLLTSVLLSAFTNYHVVRGQTVVSAQQQQPPQQQGQASLSQNQLQTLGAAPSTLSRQREEAATAAATGTAGGGHGGHGSLPGCRHGDPPQNFGLGHGCELVITVLCELHCTGSHLKPQGYTSGVCRFLDPSCYCTC